MDEILTWTDVKGKVGNPVTGGAYNLIECPTKQEVEDHYREGAVTVGGGAT